MSHSLQSLQEESWHLLQHHLDDAEKSKLEEVIKQSPKLKDQLVKAITGSRYILDSICRDSALLFHWLLVEVPYNPLTADKIFQMVELSCCDCDSLQETDQLVRRLRRRLMVALYWRDLNGLADFQEVIQAMTSMAEAFIQQVLNSHYHALCDKHGAPIGCESQQPQSLFVLGMGKLGGSELNVSSDIDLIFAYPEQGETNHPEKPLENSVFFTRLGQRVIKSLNDITVDGFVFRVDMRLRPYGDSGSLVSHFAALEKYYQEQGREWERFAAIKTRVIACNEQVNNDLLSVRLRKQGEEQLNTIFRSFAYRQYSDFSVIESLRKLKAMIVQEVQRKGMNNNIKLGYGGIRELEFIIQSFQLTDGGRHRELQERHWFSVLEQLKQKQYLSISDAETLRESYLFLRRLEHRLQAWQDQQTQALPDDEKQQEVLAWLMGFDHWLALKEKIEYYRQLVSQYFQLVIAEPESSEPEYLYTTKTDVWSSIWHSVQRQEDFSVWADAIVESYDDIKGVQDCLQHFCECGSVRRLPDASRELLDQLMPQLLAVAAQNKQPLLSLQRMTQWLQKVVGRQNYLILLLENPSIQQQLIHLFVQSEWVLERLTQTPSLLDELLHREQYQLLPSLQDLSDDLRQRLLRINADDLEAQMEALRYFKLAHSLRVAISELSGELPLMKISDYLTWIAEAILNAVLPLAWQQLTARHGAPSLVSADASDKGFMIVGYGKLGGIELNYSSDLDLVFIYQADAQGVTQGDPENGQKPIDHPTFYTRLGQKIIHILNTRTLSGQLYEVDMRLRPSGNSGLLVSTLNAFERYQQQDAWVWEHQALVRARSITGDLALASEFESLRQRVLRQERDVGMLKGEVIDMRQKMRDHLGSQVFDSQGKASTKKRLLDKTGDNQKKTPEKPLFHLKQDAGGIVDIEFMVQYAVLAWSHQCSGLAEYTDNIRILESLRDSGYVATEQVDRLINIYQYYRSVSHRLALQQQSSLVGEDQLGREALLALQDQCQQVTRYWQQLFD